MIAVYKITNPIGQIYIGGTSNFEKRINHYKRMEHKGQIKLYDSFLKFGFENHKIEVLEECFKENLSERESYYGHLLGVLLDFNLNDLLPKSVGFISASESKRKRLSETQSGEKNHFYGRKHTQEVKDKIRDFNKGRKHTLEHRMKVSKNNAKVNAKVVLDLNTGVFYESAKEVSETFNLPHSTLRSRLNGSLKNTTQFIYC